MSGCGTHDLCNTLGSRRGLPDVLRQIKCEHSRPLSLGSSGHSGTSPDLHLALSMLLVALGMALS